MMGGVERSNPARVVAGKISSKFIQLFYRMKSPKDGCRIFNNLAEDEDLFSGTGDYQFEIYR
jgi:hypothetical protein